MEAPSFSRRDVHIFPGELIDERMYLIPAGDEPVVITPTPMTHCFPTWRELHWCTFF